MSNDILFEERGKVGLITLNRPKALNAISIEMVRAMTLALDQWAASETIRAVIILGAGGKAFAAGGDIQRLYEFMSAKDMSYPIEFFAEEYRLNQKIKRFPKPYISIYNGIVMGGGVGVSVHGSCRIATDATILAMPETGIGFFPDVGGTYFMPRLNGGLGNYMALTGARLDGGDCVTEGLADHYIKVGEIDSLIYALVDSDNIGATIKEMSVHPPIGKHATIRNEIRSCFNHSSIEEVIRSLEKNDTEWANSQLNTIRQKSPLSVAVTWEQLRRGATLDFEQCLQLEYRIALASCQTGEFREGVRALLIDKDNTPQWRHVRVEDVSEEEIQAHFQEPSSGDMKFNLNNEI